MIWVRDKLKIQSHEVRKLHSLFSLLVIPFFCLNVDNLYHSIISVYPLDIIHHHQFIILANFPRQQGFTSPFTALLLQPSLPPCILLHNSPLLYPLKVLYLGRVFYGRMPLLAPTTVIGSGPSLSLKRHTYKAAGGYNLMSYPGPLQQATSL